MKEESLLLLSDLQKLINQVVLIDYTIIILEGEIMDDAKLTPEELEEMEKQFWEIVRKYRPEISEEKNLIQNNKIYAKDCAYGLTLLHSCEYTVCVEGKPL